MRERPILFSAPMVRALLDGRKTQTRRIIKPQPPEGAQPWCANGEWSWRRCSPWTSFACRHGKEGERLWVKETWRPLPINGLSVTYAADGKQRLFDDGDIPDGWTIPKAANTGNVSPLFMPRWASRLTLEITNVRVQRLQEISEDDARAEGLTPITKDNGRTIKYGIPDRDGLPGTDNDGWPWLEWNSDPRVAFKTLWERINGADSWAANPWAWALTFALLERP